VSVGVSYSRRRPTRNLSETCGSKSSFAIRDRGNSAAAPKVIEIVRVPVPRSSP